MTEENNQKERKRFGMGNYKPRFLTQDQIQESLKALSTKSKEQKPISLRGKMNVEQQEKHSQPRFGRPQKPFSWTGQEHKPFPWQQQKPVEQPKQEQQKEEEVQPYWSPQDWEKWALDLYNNYPETKQFLPSWFIKAVEEEQK